jgi:predicted GNAT family N-acyltransferase
VFVDELGSAGWTQDPQDDEAVHALVRNRLGHPVATARLTREAAGIARIAAWRSPALMRSTGIGRTMMQALMQVAPSVAMPAWCCSSQCSAQGFYDRLGFLAIGEPVRGGRHPPHRHGARVGVRP